MNKKPNQKVDHSIIKPWYSEIKKQLKTHIKSIKTIEESAERKNAEEGQFMRQVNKLIMDNIDSEHFSVTDLAKALLLSRAQLHRKVSALTSMSPGRYIRYVRVSKAKELLETGEYNVCEVIWQVGFISVSHFTRVFQQQYGFKPSSLKK
jgi:transcriptional regulator GlxA family with amidase domain